MRLESDTTDDRWTHLLNLNLLSFGGAEISTHSSDGTGDIADVATPSDAWNDLALYVVMAKGRPQSVHSVSQLRWWTFNAQCSEFGILSVWDTQPPGSRDKAIFRRTSLRIIRFGSRLHSFEKLPTPTVPRRRAKERQKSPANQSA